MHDTTVLPTIFPNIFLENWVIEALILSFLPKILAYIDCQMKTYCNFEIHQVTQILTEFAFHKPVHFIILEIAQLS